MSHAAPAAPAPLLAEMMERCRAANRRRTARRRARQIREAHADALGELVASDVPDAAGWAVRLVAALHDATEAEVLAAVAGGEPRRRNT